PSTHSPSRQEAATVSAIRRDLPVPAAEKGARSRRGGARPYGATAAQPPGPARSAHVCHQGTARKPSLAGRASTAPGFRLFHSASSATVFRAARLVGRRALLNQSDCIAIKRVQANPDAFSPLRRGER